MNVKNSKFFEEYKELDRLCSDIFGEKNGITHYIDEMTAHSSKKSGKDPEWDSTLKNLKKYRHIRNEIAHGELSVNGSDVDSDDVKWIKDFYKKVERKKDPLAHKRHFSKNKNGKSKSKAGFILTILVLLIIVILIWLLFFKK